MAAKRRAAGRKADREARGRSPRAAPRRNADLDGNAPDKNETALLLIDVINDLDFPEARRMLPAAERMALRLARLKKRARAAGVPVIYVNDNFGRWQSDFRRIVEHCSSAESRGRGITRQLAPDEEDYFVLKPKHSGFFSSTLETLLRYLGCETLVLTGIAGNFCVLFTANDAYMRDYNLIIPEDCCVSNSEKENRQALGLMRNFLKAKTPPSRCVRFKPAR